jgi:hypothetical protein
MDNKIDDKIARINTVLNEILLSLQLTLEIARLLLECVFVSWNKPETLLEEKIIRRYLIVDFYQILCKTQTKYLEEMQDFSKTSDEHLLTQNKFKKITELAFLLQKKDYHDEIIYLMNILS